MNTYNVKYDYTCKECGHEFDYHEGFKSGGYDHQDWVECPFCKTLEIEPNER